MVCVVETQESLRAGHRSPFVLCPAPTTVINVPRSQEGEREKEEEGEREREEEGWQEEGRIEKV